MTEPVVAQKGPYEVQVVAGRNYFWCACGLSGRQPYCDGSHSQTDFKPEMFKAERDGPMWLCGCKQTGNKPECDGTHGSL